MQSKIKALKWNIFKGDCERLSLTINHSGCGQATPHIHLNYYPLSVFLCARTHAHNEWLYPTPHFLLVVGQPDIACAPQNVHGEDPLSFSLSHKYQ